MSKRKSNAEVIEELPPGLPPDPENHPQPSPFNQFMDAATDDSGIKAAELLSALPVNQGYYFKIYKRNNSVGARPLEFKCDLEYLEPIYDLETELQRRITDNHWGSGEYLVRTHCAGQRGIQKAPILLFITDLSQGGKPAGNGNGTAGDPSVITLAPILEQLIKKLEAPPQSPLNLSELATALSNVMTAGVNAAKANQPTASSGDSTKELVKAVMDSIKQLTPAPPKEETSPLKLIIEMQKAGIIPERKKEEDSLAQIKNVVGIVASLRELNPPEPSGRTSTAVAVLQALSPHIGEVVGAVREGISLMRVRSGMPPGPKRINPAPASTGPDDATLVKHPLFLELKEAIDKNDHNYFPRLVHGIGYWFDNGDQYLAAAASGTMSVEAVQSYLVNSGGQYFSQGPTKDFLTAFLSWYRAYIGMAYKPDAVQTAPGKTAPAAAVLEPGELAGVCSMCGASYGFESAEALEEDNICDAPTLAGGPCGGKIILEEKKGNA